MWVRVTVGVAVASFSVASMSGAGAASNASRLSHAVTVSTAAVIPPDTVTDPAGDVPFDAGDIIGAGFAQTSTSLVFGIKVKTPLDPATDPTWTSGFVFLEWELDSNNDGSPDYNVALMQDGAGGMSATFFSLATFETCAGSGAFVAGYGFTATFATPTSCFPLGAAFRFRAKMIYAPPPITQTPPPDYAPDNNLFGPTVTTAQPVSVTPKGGTDGYWMLGADGRVYPFGGAVGFSGLVPGATAVPPRRDGKGYWITDAFGRVHAHGTAVSFGGSPALGAGEIITTISATASAKGYWLFSNKGRVFAFGDAHRYGDLSATHLNGAIVASTATPSGKGYYMVGRDGGIFAFGDARFHGSTGGMRLNKPIVGMSPTPDGRGYWLVGSDGGVFAFNAPFRGSMGGTRLNQAVDGLVAYGNGYLMAASDGGIFDFSNRAFLGSLARNPPSAPIIGLAAFTT